MKLKEWAHEYGDAVWDIAGECTRQYLIDCYELQKHWEGEPDSDKILKALKRIIKYVSTTDQWKEFENNAL